MVSEAGEKEDRGEMALAANIFNNLTITYQKVKMLFCICYASITSLSNQTACYTTNRGRNLLGQPKEMLLARNISSPLWIRNQKDLHSDTECPLTYLMKLGMFWKLNRSIWRKLPISSCDTVSSQLIFLITGWEQKERADPPSPNYTAPDKRMKKD